MGTWMEENDQLITILLASPSPLTWSPGALDEALKVWMIVPGATLIEICTLSLPLAISGAGVSSTAHKADCSRW